MTKYFYVIRQAKSNPTDLLILFAGVYSKHEYIIEGYEKAEQKCQGMTSQWGHRYNFFVQDVNSAQGIPFAQHDKDN